MLINKRQDNLHKILHCIRLDYPSYRPAKLGAIWCVLFLAVAGALNLNVTRRRDYSLLIVPPSAGGRAGVLGVPAQLIVDRLPGLLTDTAVIAALLADLLVEHVEINWNKDLVRRGEGQGGETYFA